VSKGRCLIVILLVAGVAGGCSEPSPTGPNTITPSVSGVFAGTVYPEGHTPWPFTLEAPSTVALTLTSIDPPSLVVGLGFGTLSGRGCDAQTEVEAQVGTAAPQLTVRADAGERCVEVFDMGGVPTSGASFTVSIRSF